MIIYEEHIIDLNNSNWSSISRPNVIESENIVADYLEAKEGIKLNRTYNNSPIPLMTYVGAPDFWYYDKEEVVFVEVKTGRDEIRQTQIKWLALHPDIKVRFVCCEIIENINDLKDSEARGPFLYPNDWQIKLDRWKSK